MTCNKCGANSTDKNGKTWPECYPCKMKSKTTTQSTLEPEIDKLDIIQATLEDYGNLISSLDKKLEHILNMLGNLEEKFAEKRGKK